MSGRTTPAGGQVSSQGVAGVINYTPTITHPGATFSAPTGSYIKLPGCLLLWAAYSVSVGAAASANITLPAGYTVTTLPGVGTMTVGSASFGSAGGSWVAWATAAASSINVPISTATTGTFSVAVMVLVTS